MAQTTFTDTVTPIVSSWLNDVDHTVYRTTNYTATAGQTVFTILSYTLGGHIMVFINGLMQIYNSSYVETDATTITFSSGLSVGDIVTVRG